MKWIKTNVGEYCPFIYGKSLPESKRENGSVPVYGSNGCVGYHSSSLVKTPGIIIGRKGSVGEIHFSPVPFHPIDTAYYIASDNVDELKFIYLKLKSLGLKKMNSDSAIPGLNRDNAHALTITIPENIKDREYIGRWLYRFNDKIELNRKINQTLESIAQAIFKSWFVDFDPVKAKIAAKKQGKDPIKAAMAALSGKTEAELKKMTKQQLDNLLQTATLFPDELVKSELGMIPKGWKVKIIEELSAKVAMGPFGSNIKVSTFVKNGIPIISGKHLKNILLEDNGCNFITEEHADKLKNSCVYSGDIVFTHAGNIGQVSLIPEGCKYNKYILSQRQFYIRPKNKNLAIYIVNYFHTKNGQQVLLANTSQVGVPSISRPSSYLKSISIIVPDDELLNLFNMLISTNYKQNVNVYNETKNLINIRDILLPQLLSGEIEVGKAARK